jgi:hypothetical protein
MVERSPEKAGVGGSIPSLATTFSNTYSHPEHVVCSILFQFQIQVCRNLPHHKMDRTCVYPPRNDSGTASVHPWEVNIGCSLLSRV